MKKKEKKLNRREFGKKALGLGIAAAVLPIARAEPSKKLPCGLKELPKDNTCRMTAVWTEEGQYTLHGTTEEKVSWYALRFGWSKDQRPSCYGSLFQAPDDQWPQSYGKSSKWVFRFDGQEIVFPAAELATAKKCAERLMVEYLRMCVVEMEKLAFAL